MMEKIALTAAEACELIGVSRPTLYQLVHRADFPAMRVGRKWIISRRGLEEWVLRQATCGAELYQ